MGTLIGMIITAGILLRLNVLGCVFRRVSNCFSVEPNGYGGIILTAGGFYAQRSGHGYWCFVRVGTTLIHGRPYVGKFEWWRCPQTGKHLRFFTRRKKRDDV